MAIVYPLDWPSNVLPSNVQFKPVASVALSESPFTYAQQTYSWPGQRWAADLDIGPLSREQGSEFRAFLLALNGREGTFYFGDPTATAPRGTAPGSPVVDGADQTGTTLNTSGWTASRTGVLLAGDYIQLGTGSSAKLYQVLQDVDSDIDGEASIDLWPKVRVSPTNGSALVLNDTKGVFRLTENVMPWSLEAPDTHSFMLGIVEAQ